MRRMRPRACALRRCRALPPRCARAGASGGVRGTRVSVPRHSSVGSATLDTQGVLDSRVSSSTLTIIIITHASVGSATRECRFRACGTGGAHGAPTRIRHGGVSAAHASRAGQPLLERQPVSRHDGVCLLDPAAAYGMERRRWCGSDDAARKAEKMLCRRGLTALAPHFERAHPLARQAEQN